MSKTACSTLWRLVQESENIPSEHLDEWEAYQVEEVGASTTRILTCLKPFVVMLCACGCARVYSFGSGLGHVAVMATPSLLICLLAGRANSMFVNVSKVSNLGRRASGILSGCLVQFVFFTVILCGAVGASLTSPTEILCHRMFLGLAVPILGSAPYLFHVPVGIFCFIFCPMWMCIWLAFHWHVEFLNLPCIIFGTMSCMFVSYASFLTSRDRWLKFQLACELEREHQCLLATQNTLHIMLSRLWDASCTCLPDGKVVSCTPQLEHLFTEGADLVGSTLSALVPNGVDSERLQTFLHDVAATENEVLTLQCTSRPRLLEKTSRPHEVSLYGVKLPPHSAGQHSDLGQRTSILFIGFLGVPEQISEVLHNADSPEVPPTSLLRSGIPQSVSSDVSSLACSRSEALTQTSDTAVYDWHVPAGIQTHVKTACAWTQTDHLRPPSLPPSSAPSPQEMAAFEQKHIAYGQRLLKKRKGMRQSHSAPPSFCQRSVIAPSAQGYAIRGNRR